MGVPHSPSDSNRYHLSASQSLQIHRSNSQQKLERNISNSACKECHEHQQQISSSSRGERVKTTAQSEESRVYESVELLAEEKRLLMQKLNQLKPFETALLPSSLNYQPVHSLSKASKSHQSGS